ncbi:platelet-activating factor acetylhydrolase isoform II [Roseibium hamelinense]|uniref:Platelet-activating factor acetylhydrolase isoform II n=1 Tax=Roseibium hamelinense TaxID=150831 RepID=A0A562T951_9HYPH|nr:dienelactone hydrolase [Roseibium hamelinense]MTI45485.1 dienelactone hydrolase [Roseibium hamelinense]TWI90141.1 platelet-activating factor acetylhydrolase isoform II [Roseibium hamelinense]
MRFRLFLNLAFMLPLIGTAHAAQNRIDTIRPDAPELAKHGDHGVGRLTLELTNPDQIDILNVGDTGDLPIYDRRLTVEVYYPAQRNAAPTPMATFLRDGETEVVLHGISAAGAEPDRTGAPYPLVLVSHGYPGNRFLMSHLAENLASKGYVTVSIDHTDSTYRDKAAFGSTLVNRPLDQIFVLDELERLSTEAGGPLNGLVDTERTGLIGYSMGGYGALIAAGAGVTDVAVDYDWGAPGTTLARHLAGSDSHEALVDDRLAAIVAIGPWGRERDFWNADGMAGLRVPTLFVAGSEDDISGYEGGIRRLWEEGTGADRHLLTFVSANHNAAAPIPAPAESYFFSETLGWSPFEHYADAVWDSVRMNNILQHFTTAFMDLHIKGDTDKAAYLDLVPKAEDGVHAVSEDGFPTDSHTYWAGFADRTAKGLRFETLSKDQNAK